jgi:YbbR domain-containing protein
MDIKHIKDFKTLKNLQKIDYRKLLLKITKNWAAKVLSLVLAILLYVFHQWASMETRVFSAPLKVETDAGFTPASDYGQQSVRVSLRGEPNGIYPIAENDIEAYIDLRGKGKGSYNAPVLIRKKGSALGVDPLEISVDPVEISISLDRKTSKSVPIRADTRGSLQDGYRLASWTLTPDHVTVDGPADVLADITEMATDDISLDGRDADFSVTARILNHEPLAALRGSGTVEFKGEVQEILSTRTYENLPITLKNLDPRFTAAAAPSTGSLIVEGRKRDLDRYSGLEALSVDCSHIQAAGTYTLHVELSLPVYFNSTARSPTSVTLTVQEPPPPEEAAQPTDAPADPAAAALPAAAPSEAADPVP